MKFAKLCSVILAAFLGASATLAQGASSAASQPAVPEEPASATSSRAEAYFDYTMGHIAEQQFDATSRSNYATQAIEYYNKAYALDPKSPLIGERLAWM